MTIGQVIFNSIHTDERHHSVNKIGSNLFLKKSLKYYKYQLKEKLRPNGFTSSYTTVYEARDISCNRTMTLTDHLGGGGGER